MTTKEVGGRAARRYYLADQGAAGLRTAGAPDYCDQGTMVPCTRVTGKWLFPKTLIDLWLAESAAGQGPARVQAPPVIAGSHDPLLDWAAQESGCGLALLPGGSLDGLKRFAGGEARLAGLHLYDAETESFNAAAVTGTLPPVGPGADRMGLAPPGPGGARR